MEEKKPRTRIKILVACHKADPAIRQDDVYMPIQVGKALHPELNLGFQCDNEGDNISEKNQSYCELTALYWAWKNLKDVDYVGLCHYRRYFDFHSNLSSTKDMYPDEVRNAKELDLSNISLNKDEAVLPSFWSTPYPVWTIFSDKVLAQDLYILTKVIEKYTPEYLPEFNKYVEGNRRTGFNMFVMGKDEFDKYCEWLFFILDKMEKAVHISTYISYARLYGYLGEILLPTYLLTKNIKIKEKRIIFAGDAKTKKIPGRRMVASILNNIAYKIGKITNPNFRQVSYWETYLKMDKINL